MAGLSSGGGDIFRFAHCDSRAANCRVFTSPSDDPDCITNPGGPLCPVETDVGFLITTFGDADLNNVTFVQNSASESGAGIYNRGGMTLDDSLLIANGLTDAPPIFFTPVRGGGIYNDGRLIVTRSQIHLNFADNGGGIYNHGAIIWPGIGTFENFIRMGFVTIDESALTGNRGFGGGAYNDGALDVTNTVFANNATLGGDGGAILNTRIKDLFGELDEPFCTIFECIDFGIPEISPGISPGVLTLNNSTVVQNVPVQIANSGTVLYLPTPGSGLILEGLPGSADLSNTILLDGFPNCSGPITSLGHNLADDGTCGLTEPTDLGANPTLGTFQIDLGPLAGGPLPDLVPGPLLAGNPAAVGDAPACDPNDYEGKTRPIDGNGDLTPLCDIGAFEFQPDADGDGVADSFDNCVDSSNPGQEDRDGDGVGDVCDNAPDDPNPGQLDADVDGVGNVADNCVDVPNPGQEDRDDDGVGDACDNAPDDPNSGQLDADADGVGDVADNCVDTPNPGQGDGDGIGDACDLDNDNDSVPDVADNCVDTPNPGQEDADGDGIGDACDLTPDGDLTPGVDLHETTDATVGIPPIPADFFFPGSGPLPPGLVDFVGDEQGPGTTDTRVQRLEPTNFPGPLPSVGNTIPIEIVALNLVSTSPITVCCEAGSPTSWQVAMGLSGPQPRGTLTATQNDPDGGTFTSEFMVQPVFIFTNVDDGRTLSIDGPPILLDLNGEWLLAPCTLGIEQGGGLRGNGCFLDNFTVPPPASSASDGGPNRLDFIPALEDQDSDGVGDVLDNCPTIPNPG